jgi:hypothetical protein
MEVHEKIENTAAIEELTSGWDQLKPVDQALEVHRMHEEGTSFRSLAKHLNCSESLLRQLNLAAQAPTSDLVLARQGKISIRELVRRYEVARKQRQEEERQARDRDRAKQAEKAAAVIRAWLRKEELGTAAGEAIVDETRRAFFIAAQEDDLPKFAPPPPGTPIQEIIEWMRPKPDPESEPVTWYARWLARWTFYVFPDEWVRDKALDTALDGEIRGS